MQKEERELIWLIKIYLCKYKKRTLGISYAGTKSDFEKVVGIQPRNKEFRLFLQDLIELGSLHFHKLSEVKAKMFVVNEKKTLKKIKSLEFGKKFYDLVIGDYLSLSLS